MAAGQMQLLKSVHFRWLFTPLQISQGSGRFSCAWFNLPSLFEQVVLLLGESLACDGRRDKANGDLTRSHLTRQQLLQTRSRAAAGVSRGAGGGRQSRNRLVCRRTSMRQKVATQQRVLPCEGVWARMKQRQKRKRGHSKNRVVS